MKLVYEDKTRRIIKNQEEIKFSSISSYHLIVLTTRVKGEKQLDGSVTDDEDLIVQIDRKNYPKLSNNNELIDSPAAFSGGKQHNLSKTVYFLTYLPGKNHKIILTADQPPNTATFETIEVYVLNLDKDFVIEITNQAEDGDRRPWITFVLDNLPLQSITPTVTYSRRTIDSDDVKIIIDGKIQDNILRNIKHFLWRFVGSILSKDSSLTEAENFTVNSPPGLHYIEFWADKMPVLNKLNINFGQVIKPPPRKPMENDPEWTGNFNHDTEEILLARAIYGEAGGESKEAKIAVAWTIRNRVEDNQNRWGKTYHEVILRSFQYEPFNDKESKIFKKITNPPLDNKGELQAWRDSFEIAGEVIYGKVADNTKGANHFYVPSDQPKQSWVDEKKFTVQIGVTRFYKL